MMIGETRIEQSMQGRFGPAIKATCVDFNTRQEEERHAN